MIQICIEKRPTMNRKSADKFMTIYTMLCIFTSLGTLLEVKMTGKRRFANSFVSGLLLPAAFCQFHFRQSVELLHGGGWGCPGGAGRPPSRRDHQYIRHHICCPRRHLFPLCDRYIYDITQPPFLQDLFGVILLCHTMSWFPQLFCCLVDDLL